MATNRRHGRPERPDDSGSVGFFRRVGDFFSGLFRRRPPEPGTSSAARSSRGAARCRPCRGCGRRATICSTCPRVWRVEAAHAAGAAAWLQAEPRGLRRRHAHHRARRQRRNARAAAAAERACERVELLELVRRPHPAGLGRNAPSSQLRSVRSAAAIAATRGASSSRVCRRVDRSPLRWPALPRAVRRRCVHSGIAAGAASSPLAAFNVMEAAPTRPSRASPKRRGTRQAVGTPVPLLVMHGDDDRTRCAHQRRALLRQFLVFNGRPALGAARARRTDCPPTSTRSRRQASEARGHASTIIGGAKRLVVRHVRIAGFGARMERRRRAFAYNDPGAAGRDAPDRDFISAALPARTEKPMAMRRA